MRLSHLTALAVMVALVGAMFVVMQTASAAPTAPSKVEVKQNAHDSTNAHSLTLSWVAPAGEIVDYDVQVRLKAADADPDEFGDWAAVGGETEADTAVTRTFGSLTDGTTYQYQVRAAGPDGADDGEDPDEGPWAQSGEIVAGQLDELGACDTTQTLELDSTADEDTDVQSCTISIAGGAGNAANTADFSGTPATSDVIDIEGAADGNEATTFVYTLTAKKAGSQVFTISGKANNLDVSATYTVTVVAASLTTAKGAAEAAPDFMIKSVAFDDSDGVVSAGTPVKATVTVENGSDSTKVRLTVPTTGLSIVDPRGGTTQSHISADEFNLVTVGAPAGEYTLTFVADLDGNFTATRNDQTSSSKTLTVGDPGGNVSTAALVLASLDDDKNPTSPSKAQSTQLPSAIADDDTRGGKVLLSLNSLNSLGKLSNASATSKISVTVTAVGASITLESATADDGKTAASTNLSGKTESAIGETTANGLQFQSTGPSSILAITKAKPGTVSVSALIVDARGDGFAASESITLTFTGPVDSIVLGDVSGTLHNVATDDGEADDTSDDDNRDKVSFSLSAQDKSGNPVGAPSVTYQITDPDGNNVASARIAPSQGPNAAGHPNAMITLASMGTAARPLASGEYTVKVSQTSTITATGTFTVVGSTNSVELDVSNMTPAEVGDIVEVTATVTDADGNAVADGTPVTFASSDQTADTDPVLARIGDTGAVNTKGGNATATYVAVGDGKSVITAVAGTKNAVAVIVSTAGASDPDAMPEEEASVSCLSELSGFSTWTCGVDSSASEVFGLVADRGKSAIHLWNGSAWVRYSVVEGTMVPGSSDFMVTKSDILYISN